MTTLVLNQETIMRMTPDEILNTFRALNDQKRDLEEQLWNYKDQYEKDCTTWTEREDTRKQTTQYVNVISDGRVTLGKKLRDALNIQVGDRVDVYRYSIDGEWPAKIMLSFPKAFVDVEVEKAYLVLEHPSKLTPGDPVIIEKETGEPTA